MKPQKLPKRCAIVKKNGEQHLFVVVPKPAPPPEPIIESLMIFDNIPEVKLESDVSASDSNGNTDGSKYVSGSAWRWGSKVIPLSVDDGGDFRVSTSFPKTEFESLDDVYSQCGPFDELNEYHTLFGSVVLDKAYILVASSIEVAVKLPFNGHIFKVLEAKWVPFVLPQVLPVKMSSTDRNRLQNFQFHYDSKGYYYSDDVDLRLQFPFIPSTDKAAPLDFFCDWSHHLRERFQSPSLQGACSMLVRGFVGERVCRLNGGFELHMILLGRQNHLNPGPRYLGRGLNDINAVGNEHTYEYVMWKQQDDMSVAYARHTILRGTIPVRWTSQPSMAISEPRMLFSPEKSDVIRGSSVYFENLFRTLHKMCREDTADASGVALPAPKLRCINLLRYNTSPDESALSRYFAESVGQAESVVKKLFPESTIDLVHLDWLTLTREYGVEFTITSFWQSAMSFLVGQDSSVNDSIMSVGVIKADTTVDRLMAQTRFLRINCADSLDRTNLGCFFTCLQLSIGMLLTLQVPFKGFAYTQPLRPIKDIIEVDSPNTYPTSFKPVSNDGHAVPKPFLNTWDEACDLERLPSAVACALAALFVDNGDCVAMLYTNSQAMHSNLLRWIGGTRSTGSNALIATQRRYENMFEDGEKFRNTELLLGRNYSLHFPSISPIFLTQPVAYSQWACTLVAIGFGNNTQAAEVEAAVRKAWDSGVVPQLAQRGKIPIESSALCLTITVKPENWGNLPDAFAAAVQSPTNFASPQAMDDEEKTNLTFRDERVAVIRFDPNLCCVVDAPALLQQYGYITIKGRRCALVQYSYPVQDTENTSGMSVAIKNVRATLKQGFKKFVRNLN
ncbi:unnamed protein product [Phytomonas sp. EM1]|nr:unnamed protein product [Phytomonas sp. EM1]|eukprot:CCW64294.1 unnamed protein product [Phytomonas sp. isolate EM1]